MNTKSKLISSLLVLVLCVTAFFGSTYAWFTDEVTSTGNKIEAGTLEVDLLLRNDQGQFVSIKGNKDPIFTYDKWEPGYTDMKFLKIQNEGTLALKWYAKFVSAQDLGPLAEVIDVYVAPGLKYYDPANGRDITKEANFHKVGTVKDFVNSIESTTYGTLEPKDAYDEKDEAFLGIALKMRESAGNEYKGLTLGNFDILIEATQKDFESDSFDNTYDALIPDTGWYFENPDATEFTIDTADELAGLAALVNGEYEAPVSTFAATGTAVEPVHFAGKTIKLDADVDLKNANWTPIGKTFNQYEFAGIFDGGNHTVSNLKVNGGAGSALFGFVRNNGHGVTGLAQVNNVNVNKASVTGTDYVGAVVGQLYGTMENCHVSDVTIIARPFKMDNGSYDGGAKAGGVVGWIESGSVYKATNLTANGFTIKAYRDLGGAIGMAHNENIITDCKAYNGILQYVYLSAGESYDGGKVNENMGEVIGRRGSGVSESGTDSENVKLIESPLITSEAELISALENGTPVILGADIELTESLNISSDTVIDGLGNTITRAAGYTGTMFTVKSGSTATFADVILDGENVTVSGNLIAAEANAKIILNDSAVLKNNVGAHAINLGTRIGATLEINEGAKIINNQSDSGAIWGGGHITMNGGEISGNSSTGIGGAIRMVSSCNFTMNGGEMNNNKAAGDGGAIWGYGSSTYNFNGGSMSNNESAGTGGAMYTGTYSVINISGDFELCNNKGANTGAIRLTDHTSMNMTGGIVSGNTQNGESNAFNTWNNNISITGGEIADDFSYVGGLGLTVGKADIDGVISYNLSTNHNTAYLAADFNGFKFKVNEDDEHFGNFNFKPAAGYTYTAGDEEKLVCMNPGYKTYWDAATSTFKLKAI